MFANVRGRWYVGAATFLITFVLGCSLVAAQEGHPLALDEAIRLAQAHASKVVQARDTVRTAELALQEAQAAFAPRLSLSAEASWNEKQALEVGAGLRANGSLTPGTTWSLVANQPTKQGDALTVSMQLWPPTTDLKVARDLADAQAELAVALRALDVAQHEVALTTVELYRKVQLNQERVLLAEDALLEAQEGLERTRSGFYAGRSSEADVIRAEVTLLEQEALLASRRAQLQAVKDQLGKLIGRSSKELQVVPLRPDELLGDELAALPSEEEVIAAYLPVSESVQAAEHALRQAEEALQRVQRDVGLGLTLGANIQPATGSSESLRWSVGISGSYTLMDGGARARSKESAEMTLRRAQTAYEEALESAKERARTSLREVEEAMRNVQLRVASEKLRRLDLDAAIEQANRGVITRAQLEERERAMRSATLDRVEAVLNFELARARLGLLMGSAEF